jgi:hypothetical protein
MNDSARDELLGRLDERTEKMVGWQIKQNGDIAELKAWKNFVVGGMSVLTLFFGSGGVVYLIAEVL